MKGLCFIEEIDRSYFSQHFKAGSQQEFYLDTILTYIYSVIN